MSDSGRVLLEGRNLVVRYGRVTALHGVTFAAREGEIVAFIGANGAGKTTLLRALSRLLPLSSGHIIFEGCDVSSCRSEQVVERGIIQVPEGRQVFAPMTVEDNVLLGSYRRRQGQFESDDLLAMFPILAEKRRAAAGSLSGGQQQLLAIARALAAGPRVLLLDEPSMGLAPIAISQIYAAVCGLRERGLTILLVEQNARAALRIADRAYVMESGTITAGGNAREIASDPAVQRAYLAH